MINRLVPAPTFAAVALGCLALLALPLSACDTSPKPPGDTGVCYQYVSLKDGKHRFNVLQQNVPSLEVCAAALEAMRIHFLSIGGNQTTISGAYQSKFIFVEQEGIFTADSLNGASYLALVRTDDGRLAQPGAVRH
jgi:hypothetical protein